MTPSQPTPPGRSIEQRMTALATANKIRGERARLKRLLKSGDLSAAEALSSAAFASGKVYDLLVALPRVGDATATRMLTTARISPSKKVAGLTVRQASELRTILNDRAARRQENHR